MNDLTPQNASALSSKQPSPALKLQLADENSNERAVREIATNQRLLAECRDLLPTLEAQAKQPAGVNGVMRVVGKRFALFGVNLTEDSAPAWWDDYYEALEDLPESALEAGMRAHIKAGGQFMPKPGELRNLALTSENRAVRAVERARAALEWQPPREIERVTPPEITPRIIRDEPTPQDKQRVREMLADYVARAEAAAPKPVEAFKVKAKVDETGITPELRALRERRAAEGDAA